MKFIRERVLNKEFMAGTFLNLGSSLTAEITGKQGFDWVLIDLEHGSGDRQELLMQLQALEGTPAAPVVRIGGNDPVLIKRILDLGVSGLMIPYISTAEEARQAVAAMTYPPKGIRGVASYNRACGFSLEFDDYFAKANDGLLTALMIETREGVENVDEIAAVEGVDALFLGPLDLSINMGIPKQFDHPDMLAARKNILAACQKHGKAAGTLGASPEKLAPFIDMGYTFVAAGSDGSAVALAMRDIANAFKKYRGI